MGLTVLEIEVGNPANPEVTEKVEFLIDSGAVYIVKEIKSKPYPSIRPNAPLRFWPHQLIK